jgi:hypothetical protein
MKNLLLILTLLPTPAFAMHAYGTDHCVAVTLDNTSVEFDLANGEPANPHRLTMPNNTDDNKIYFVNIDQSKDSQDEPVGTAQLVLKVTQNVITGHKKLDDGCFQGEAHTSIRTMTVQKLDKDVADAFSIKVGDVLHFTCYSDSQYPSGNQCGK